MEEEALWERVGKVLRDAALVPEKDRRVLVFMPGVHEIRKTVELLEKSSVARGYEVLPLYSGLPPQAQRAAVATAGGPRIIVATNVAETSITIDGISLVVDSGLARMAKFDVRRGIDSLLVSPISRAAAEQRAGRAGRTGPGKCVRLWSEADHGRREGFELPEVKRVDLAEAVLYLKAAGWNQVMDFRWLDGPEEESLARAEHLLERLGAVEGGKMTKEGRLMAGFPLHPRMARLLLAAESLDCVSEACFAAAVLQGEGVFAKKAGKDRERFVEDGDWSDFRSGLACGDGGGEGELSGGKLPRNGSAGAQCARDAGDLEAAVWHCEESQDGFGPGEVRVEWGGFGEGGVCWLLAIGWE